MKRYATLYRVKPETRKTWQDWCTLRDTTERFNAVQTLRDHRITFEFGLKLEMEGTLYVVLYREGELEKDNGTFSGDSELELLMGECLEKVTDMPILYHLRAD